MEIERKWLIDINKIPYDLSKLEALEIKQAYISFDPTIRIRQITNKNVCILTMKSKSLDKGLSRQEYELEISLDQYNKLLTKKEGIELSKTRYIVIENNHKLEIDLFHNEYEGLAYMEIEFDTVEQAKEYVAPNWIEYELTNNKSLTNSALAKGLIKIDELYQK